MRSLPRNNSAGGISLQETEQVEFKRMVTDDIAKEVIAFANAKGGTIYIGVADDGSPVGLEDFDAEYMRLSNIVRDAILPDVTVFVHYTKMEGIPFCGRWCASGYLLQPVVVSQKNI